MALPDAVTSEDGAHAMKTSRRGFLRLALGAPLVPVIVRFGPAFGKTVARNLSSRAYREHVARLYGLKKVPTGWRGRS